MNWIRRLMWRIEVLLRRSRVEKELADELQYHLNREVQENLRRGMGPEAARRLALVEFGGVERTKERVREVWGVRVVDNLFRDLRFGFRTLKRRPFFTVTVIATLSLGIGTVTSMFSVVDAVLLHPLPFGRPGELVAVWQARPSYRDLEVRSRTWDRYPLSYPQYEQWREGAALFQGVSIHGMREGVLSWEGAPAKLQVGLGSASLLPVLGVRTVLGRWFMPGEDGPEAPKLAVLSYELWQGRFGADTLVLGQILRLDDKPYAIIGVLPREFRLRRAATRGETDLGERALWIPVGAGGTDLSSEQSSFEGIGRLAPGVSVAQSRAEARALLDDQIGDLVIETRVEPLREVENRGARAPLLLLLGATGLLLLIACGNSALLLLAEAAGRHHEMGVRVALGAGRSRLVGQLLAEGGALGLLGGLGGFLMAVGGTATLVALAPPMPRLDDVAVNPRALLVSTGLGILCGCVFGLAPLLGIRREALGSTTRPRLATASGGHRYVQEGIVALEIAFTLVLAAFGGLLVRSYAGLVEVDPGFQASDLAVAHVALPEGGYRQAPEHLVVFDRVRTAVERIPGVLDVRFAARVPFLDRCGGNVISVEGRETPTGERWPMAVWNAVDPGFLETMGIPLVAGQALSPDDGAGGPGVMVVNETMARTIWPHRTPVGERVRWSDRVWDVVGVVGDVSQGELSGGAEPAFYVPISQYPLDEASFVVKTAEDPSAILHYLPDILTDVDSGILLEDAGTMAGRIRDSVREERFRTLLMVVFAGTASLLALVGVFGVTARAAEQRTREFGIRMALGESRERVITRAALSSSLTVALGSSLGLAFLLPTSPILKPYLFQIGGSDPLVLATVVASLATTAFSASYLAARHVSAVDPVDMLRSD